MKHILFVLELLLSINVHAETFTALSPEGVEIQYEVSYYSYEYEYGRHKIAVVIGIPSSYIGPLTIPAGVEYKGEHLSVRRIGSSAFMNHTGLTSVWMDECYSIGDMAFTGCENLESVHIDVNGLEEIGDGAFAFCSNLTSFENDPYLLRSIGEYAFNGCSSLKYLFYGSTLSSCERLESIGKYAFQDCWSLTSFEIPYSEDRYGNSIDISIGEGAFRGCDGLTSVTFHCSEIGNWFSRLSSIKSVRLGWEVTNIKAYAFYDCAGLTSIEIPGSVKTIGEYNQEIKGVTNVEIIPVSA